MQDGYAGHRLRLLAEAERAAVEGNTLRKARHIDADGNDRGHWLSRGVGRHLAEALNGLKRDTKATMARNTNRLKDRPWPMRPGALRLRYPTPKWRARVWPQVDSE